jgi:putative DNA primase/helicase
VVPTLLNSVGAAHAEETLTFLRTLIESGSVFEIRVLGVGGTSGSRGIIASGYFTAEHITQAVAAIQATERSGKTTGVHVTLNPVLPDALARADHRMKKYPGVTTSDADVTGRRSILFDIDPQRPRGVSSTDKELEDAAALAASLQQHLTQQGWPAPLVVMSGNGYQLTYRIDLPANDNLVRQVLEAVSQRFSTDKVTIDRAVGDAARCCKVPGTWARKGEDFQGGGGLQPRPHRIASLISVPDCLTVVPRELLEQVCAASAYSGVAASPTPPTVFAKPPAGGPRFGRFELSVPGVRGYLESHGVRVVRERNKGDHTCLDLDRCPVNPDCQAAHSDISVLVFNSGPIIYRNLHNRGAGLRWVDVRDALEPGYRAHVERIAAKAESDASGHAPSLDARNRVDSDPSDPIDLTDLAGLATEFTDAGNAARLALQFKDRLIYSFAEGSWLVWDKTCWSRKRRDVPMKLAVAVAQSISREADARPQRTKEVQEWARKSQQVERLKAMLKIAEAFLAVRTDELDTHPYLLTVLNGTIDLRSGTLRAHDPKDRITRVVPIDFRADAPAPRWNRFLSEVLPDPEVTSYLQRFCGTCLTGDTSEQVILILLGGGANGKSIFIETISQALGEHAVTAPPDLLTVTRMKEHPTEIADLYGARLVTISELEPGAVLRGSRLKQLTGDRHLKGRFMRKDFFQFVNTLKLVLVTNVVPDIQERNEAMRRRVRLVNFPITIPKHLQDRWLASALRAELAGILAWMVAGCRDWQNRGGLDEPAVVTQASQKVTGRLSPLATFVQECCLLGDELWVASKDLRKALNDWQKQDRTPPITFKALSGWLKAQGLGDGKRRGVRGWSGIALRPLLGQIGQIGQIQMISACAAGGDTALGATSVQSVQSVHGPTSEPVTGPPAAELPAPSRTHEPPSTPPPAC